MKETKDTEELHRKAEAKVASQLADVEACSEDLNTKRLLHELMEHQVELEMQNEELRQANDKITEHKEHLSNIIKKTPAGYFHLDLEGRFLDVNNACLQMHGYESADEVIGKHLSMMQVEGSSDSALAHLAELQRGIPIPYGEFCSRRKDGSVGHHVFSAHPVERMGTVVGFEWFIIDITDRKRTEELLRESTSNLLTLHESMRDAFVSVTMDGRLLDFNSSYLELLGYPEEELRSKTYVDLTPEKWHDFEAQIVAEQVLPHGFSEVYEKEYRHKDGTLIPIELRTVLIRDASGEPKLMWAIIRDIGERKRIEAALADAKNAAEQANRAKSQFLANMSHEIRTPLTAIVGFAELLEDTELSEEQEKYLRAISSSSENMLSLIDDILDLSRLEAGKLKLNPSNFSLREIVNEVIATQEPVAQAKGLAIKVGISDDTPDILTGDPLRVKQILLNLIINAVKFTDKGNITCVVDVEEKHDSTVLLRFDVSDTGIGLNPEDIENIFAPFIQVDTSNTRKKGGAGLGLTVCNQLVSLMEGDIRVDTEVNAGSTFHVRIPFVVNDATPSTYNVRHVDQSQLWVDMPLHVLLVEDNETSRQLFTQMLKKHGHSVDVAENGAMALERWRQTNYDIVLMDVQMPVMDGIVATEKIREMERGGDTKTPIIALTAHAMKKDRSKMTTKGFDGYLTKPTRIKDLFNEMKQCLLKSSHQDHL